MYETEHERHSQFRGDGASSVFTGGGRTAVHQVDGAGADLTVTELDALLELAGKRGYLWHLFRTDRHGPEVLAGVRAHDGCADVLVLLDADRARAYRTPTDGDLFAPTRVYWWYGASPVWTLRALLTLPPPGDPAPLIPAPTGLAIPGDRLPVRVRRRGVVS